MPSRGLTLSNPIRTCVGCGQKRPQPTLTRLVRTPKGKILPGRDLPGRGVWICGDSIEACLIQARRSRGFERSLRAKVTDPATDEDWIDLHSGIEASQCVSSLSLR